MSSKTLSHNIHDRSMFNTIKNIYAFPQREQDDTEDDDDDNNEDY